MPVCAAKANGRRHIAPLKDSKTNRILLRTSLANANDNASRDSGKRPDLMLTEGYYFPAAPRLKRLNLREDHEIRLEQILKEKKYDGALKLAKRLRIEGRPRELLILEIARLADINMENAKAARALRENAISEEEVAKTILLLRSMENTRQTHPNWRNQRHSKEKVATPENDL